MVTAASPRGFAHCAQWLCSGMALALLLAGTVLQASRWVKEFRAKSESPQAFFLPVQSKSARSLGAAKILVASRDLADPNFAETVVLLIHYDEGSVVGLILNRRTKFPLSRVLQGLKGAEGRSDTAYLGGPVETSTVFALLQSPTKLEDVQPIFGDVYLIFGKAFLEQTISERLDSGVFHVYLGYAGWTNDQLRKEVEMGAWFVFPADAGTVFDSDPDSLWSRMIRKTEQKLAGNAPPIADQSTLIDECGSLREAEGAAIVRIAPQRKREKEPGFGKT